MPLNPLAQMQKSIVLVGLMGSGKSSIGRRLATRLGLPFKDADAEVEAAAGCSIDEIFSRYGEAAFRDGERRVIRRLLSEPPHVLATGGGAFMDPDTRDLIRAQGVSVWLRADLDLLVARTSRRNHRPLLKNADPREVLSQLIEVRYPIYAESDVVVDTDDSPQDVMVERVIAGLRRYLAEKGAGTAEGDPP
ncbi:MAG TPA: shikimate kinase [Azospirillaceae bacterium]|nr:shikimate kinase [Azospirillaceae bacterium]